jgi:hypothetical protein
MPTPICHTLWKSKKGHWLPSIREYMRWNGDWTVELKMEMFWFGWRGLGCVVIRAVYDCGISCLTSWHGIEFCCDWVDLWKGNWRRLDGKGEGSKTANALQLSWIWEWFIIYVSITVLQQLQSLISSIHKKMGRLLDRVEILLGCQG